nr:site-specific integrase [Alkaliphilus flagellatus]
MLKLLDIIKAKKNKNTGEPIAERTVRNYMNILKALFRTAMELEIIKKNPIENIKYTVDDYQLQNNYYDLDDINKMIFALDDEPLVYQFAILLTLSTGLRLGELIALTEDDFNREEHYITISKALSETKGKKEYSLTKTKKIRVEYYPEELEQLLDEHLEIEALKKQQLGVENNLIFTGIKGDFIAKKTISDWFRRFLIRNGLKRITFHGLRHTSATMLLASGIPLKNVAERLGHSRASTTANIYAHAIPRIDKDAANVFSNILSGGTQDKNLKVVK